MYPKCKTVFKKINKINTIRSKYLNPCSSGIYIIVEWLETKQLHGATQTEEPLDEAQRCFGWGQLMVMTRYI